MDPSLVNYLTSKGMDTSPEARASLYEKNGLGKASDYLTAHQATLAGTGDNSSLNTALLNKLRASDAPVSSLITTAKGATNEFNQHSTDLQSMLGQISALGGPTTPPASGAGDTTTKGLLDDNSDPYISALNGAAATSGAATKALVNSILANRAQQGKTIDAQYDNYKRGLQGLGIQHNEAAATPDLLLGHINQAENEHQQKISALNVTEQKALMDAEKAQTSGDLATLKDKMAYIKTIQTQKQNYLKNIASNLTSESTIDKNLVSQVYDKLITLPPDQQELFLTTVAKQYGISLGGLVAAQVSEKAAREKTDLATQNARANLARKNGSGTGGSFKTSAEIPKVSATMIKNKGADGFVDPYAWVKAREIWNGKGGSDSSFNSNFKKYLNPESYGIAGFKG